MLSLEVTKSLIIHAFVLMEENERRKQTKFSYFDTSFRAP